MSLQHAGVSVELTGAVAGVDAIVHAMLLRGAWGSWGGKACKQLQCGLWRPASGAGEQHLLGLVHQLMCHDGQCNIVFLDRGSLLFTQFVAYGVEA
jgi:hypothetical protein